MCEILQRQMAHPLDEVTAPGQKMLRDETSVVNTLAGAARPNCRNNGQCSIARITAPPWIRLDHDIG